MALAMLKCVLNGTRLSRGMMAWFQRGCRCEARTCTWLGDGRTVSQMPYLALEEKTFPPCPPLRPQGRVFHTSLSGVCRRCGRLLGRCCSLPALSGTANYNFPQVRLTRLEGVCLSTRSAVPSCGMETALHTHHCSFLIGDWFPCECVCVRVCLSKTSNTLIAGFLIALYENTHSLQAFI